MNKYIYKVIFKFFYTTIRTKIMHKHELYFGKQQTVQNNFNNKKLMANSLRSMNASRSKPHFTVQ